LAPLAEIVVDLPVQTVALVGVMVSGGGTVTLKMEGARQAMFVVVPTVKILYMVTLNMLLVAAELNCALSVPWLGVPAQLAGKAVEEVAAHRYEGEVEPGSPIAVGVGAMYCAGEGAQTKVGPATDIYGPGPKDSILIPANLQTAGRL
jgi:hypothetical protein